MGGSPVARTSSGGPERRLRGIVRRTHRRATARDDSREAAAARARACACARGGGPRLAAAHAHAAAAREAARRRLAQPARASPRRPAVMAVGRARRQRARD
jgi:hypothetical protein